MAAVEVSPSSWAMARANWRSFLDIDCHMGASTRSGSWRLASATPDDTSAVSMCGGSEDAARQEWKLMSCTMKAYPLLASKGATQRAVADAPSVRGDRLSERRRSGRLGQLRDLMAGAALQEGDG